MTVSQLIEELNHLVDQGHGNHVVKVYDPDGEEFYPVTGMLYKFHGEQVLLFSDDMGG